MKIIAISLLVLIGHYNSFSQCNPPGAFDCESAPIICNLNELDGYTCTLPDIDNPTGPNPLCFGERMPQNTNWWAFMGTGDIINITINFDPSSCTRSGTGCTGIQAGIVDDCGGDPRDCNVDCNSNDFTLSTITINCRPYYLWIDGCCGDVCEYTIAIQGGKQPEIPKPLPIPEVMGSACPCGVGQVCVDDLVGECEGYTSWTIDGIDYPDFDGLDCVEFEVIEEGLMEICVTFTIGNPFDPNSICDQETSCLTFLPEPILEKYDGVINVCWEDHEDSGYVWEDRDTIIYSSCIDPPCKIRQPDAFGCCVDYVATINLLPERPIEQVYIFICDTTKLPYITDDGREWYEGICDEEITWKDPNLFHCDTTYVLNLSIYDPEVIISTSCPNCDSNRIIFADITYEQECITGQTTWTPYWMNELGDTLGFGDSIVLQEKGRYSLVIQVTHINNYTGETTSCWVSDSSWFATIGSDSLSISGDSLICQVDTSAFALPDAYGNGCGIVWSIEGLDGKIITDTSKNASSIEVYWPDDNTSDGKICAEIVDTCSTIKKTCRVLKGCFITQINSLTDSYWQVYPNPTHDMIYIRGENMNEIQIKMYNIHGDELLVQPKRDIDGAISVSVKNTVEGIYFIQLKNGDKLQTIRFLKL